MSTPEPTPASQADVVALRRDLGRLEQQLRAQQTMLLRVLVGVIDLALVLGLFVPYLMADIESSKKDNSFGVVSAGFDAVGYDDGFSVALGVGHLGLALTVVVAILAMVQVWGRSGSRAGLRTLQTTAVLMIIGTAVCWLLMFVAMGRADAPFGWGVVWLSAGVLGVSVMAFSQAARDLWIAPDQRF
ncbi:hypothetical protein GIS00_18450 [Nakamurella sp. YIM 132087]|uniref:Uncharacterized protein n=1 Tax=Nakamurella alba TaxID=2665158 RepID=A0A7K1FRC8_9ACTN|nr:hypothetical protein [Nakamurella alba]MTD15919.1 hypothetical protein [Nakamurella alba]